jgi:hypothetical protein
MKRLLSMLAVLAIVVAPVLAEDARDLGKDMTLKGTMAKVENDGKVTYTLTMTNGNVATIPAPVAKEGAVAIKLDDFVGAEVEVAVKGDDPAGAHGTTYTIKEVVSVKKVEAAPAQ